MPAKKTRKKPEVKAEDKEKIIEEIDIALSENTGVEEESGQEKKDSGKETSVEERIQNLDEEDHAAQDGKNISEELQDKEDKGDISEASDLNLSSESDTGTDSIFATPLAENEATKKKGKNWSFIIIVICLCIISILAGFVGGYFYGKSINSSPEPMQSSQNQTEEAPTPTPTEEAVDLASYSIEILNGSGVAGVAASEQTALENDGFTVSNTGNADNQNFTDTEIEAKKSVPQGYIDKLKESLSKDYKVSSSSSELDSSSSYDVVVTLGSSTP